MGVRLQQARENVELRVRTMWPLIVGKLFAGVLLVRGGGFFIFFKKRLITSSEEFLNIIQSVPLIFSDDAKPFFKNEDDVVYVSQNCIKKYKSDCCRNQFMKLEHPKIKRLSLTLIDSS